MWEFCKDPFWSSPLAVGSSFGSFPNWSVSAFWQVSSVNGQTKPATRGWVVGGTRLWHEGCEEGTLSWRKVCICWQDSYGLKCDAYYKLFSFRLLQQQDWNTCGMCKFLCFPVVKLLAGIRSSCVSQNEDIKCVSESMVKILNKWVWTLKTCTLSSRIEQWFRLLSFPVSHSGS